jgi:F420-non-reducing hydrogenase iron-sulfur subunit
MTFEPQIVGFLCNWCSYTGADLAGTSRIHYAANVRIIRVMCSARIDPTFVLKALHDGADGVLICGCHPGDCHYSEGNYKMMRRYPLLKSLLADYGIEEERVLRRHRQRHDRTRAGTWAQFDQDRARNRHGGEVRRG